MKKRLLGLIVSCLVLGLSSLWAQERGSIRGLVKSKDGPVIESATVKVVGQRLAAGQEFITGKDGSFLFQALPPGMYKLTATHPQMLDFEIDVIVALDKQTFVNVSMTPVGKIEEEVTVTAASPVVDLKSTTIASNWQNTMIEKLPLGRSYASLFQLAPGVADNRDFAPNAGGNKQDNVYLYDGSNITNPLFGYLGANFSELDIEEVNFKRGGISAEFGRATGMVTNAITKSGSNRIAGTVRFVYAPSGFTGKFRDPNIITKYNQYNPALSLGGPLIRDKLWWYVSANLPYSKTTGRVNTLGAVPDAKTTSNEFFVKLSANPLPAHQFSASFRNNKYKSTNAGIGVNDAPSVAIDGDGHDRIFYASWVWTITQSTLLEVKYDRVDEKYKSVPIRDLGYQPAFDPKALDAMGYFRTATGYIYPPATLSGKFVGAASEYNTQNFFRNEVKLVFSKYLDFRNHSHIIKAGFGYDDGGEYLERLANGWGSIITTTYGGKFAFRARYYSRQAPQDSRGRTYSIFLQDTATIGERLTFTLGILLNRDEFSSKTATKNTFLKFNFDQEVQPRIGFTYMLDKNAGDKLYANWGRYNNMDNRSLARAWAPIRIYRNDAYFDATGKLLADTPQAGETGKLILPDLKATYTDEFVAGYARPLGGPWSVEVWGQYRTMKHMLEDYAVYRRSTSPSNFVGGNLDGQVVSYSSLPPALQAKLPAFADFTAGKARRIYKAFTIEVKRQFADRWSLTGTYTLSRMEGNWDLDYQAGAALFYASSYLEDAPGLFVSEPNRDGILTGDRTHIFKLFGTWELYKRTTLGVYWRIQSGAPWEPRGQDYYGNYYRYLAKAGSSRLATWGNFDAQVSHVIPIGRFNATLELRAVNVLNTQTVMGRDLRSDQPTFLRATSYASPRSFALTFYLNF
ncbi:MAG: hypothetical protein A2W03_08440 [Candidatus Aminicenantes bacterium RBG_16_63_16]|nr:MAG: hypothetical protein A2W03_08440 [Candidatus Aminicenantes bacterium RBG_16_63_16]